MIISDDRFGAAYTLEDGTEKVFDDLGGLLIHGRETGELSEAVIWVSDFDERVLVDAETSSYVPTLGVASPMGHGILAFSDLDGEVIDWATVVELPVTDGLVGDHHEGGGGMDMGDGG